jgi:periplasmic divalent cation tolerance protein
MSGSELDERKGNGKVRVLLSTCPQGKAEELARYLVEQRLVACVNVVPQVRSFYWWEGKMEADDESLLVIKCPQEVTKTATRALVDKHPYDVPEVVALDVTDGNPDYLAWVCASAREP